MFILNILSIDIIKTQIEYLIINDYVNVIVTVWILVIILKY